MCPDAHPTYHHHLQYITQAVRNCLKAARQPDIICSKDPSCAELPAHHNTLEIRRTIQLNQKQKDGPQCGLYVLDALVQLYTIRPDGQLLTKLHGRSCRQMQDWRMRLLRDIWDFVDWEKDVMITPC